MPLWKKKYGKFLLEFFTIPYWFHHPPWTASDHHETQPLFRLRPNSRSFMYKYISWRTPLCSTCQCEKCLFLSALFPIFNPTDNPREHSPWHAWFAEKSLVRDLLKAFWKLKYRVTSREILFAYFLTPLKKYRMFPRTMFAEAMLAAFRQGSSHSCMLAL